MKIHSPASELRASLSHRKRNQKLHSGRQPGSTIRLQHHLTPVSPKSPPQLPPLIVSRILLSATVSHTHTPASTSAHAHAKSVSIGAAGERDGYGMCRGGAAAKSGGARALMLLLLLLTRRGFVQLEGGIDLLVLIRLVANRMV